MMVGRNVDRELLEVGTPPNTARCSTDVQADRCTVAQNFICGFPTCYAEHISRPAQPGAIADAAARRGCRDDLGGWLRSTIMPIERCGAAKRQAVGR